MMKKRWREINGNEEESEAKKKGTEKNSTSAADMCGYAPNVGSRKKHSICG